MSRPSIYEFAGGDAAFRALAAAHHERCLEGPELNHPFSHGMNPKHIEHLADYWAEAFGGPPRYSESHGGHSGMLEIHARQGNGEDFGPRFVACFMQAADDANLPDDADFRNALRSYMEWATGEVLAYAPPQSKVPADLHVPHWGWHGPESLNGPGARPRPFTNLRGIAESAAVRLAGGYARDGDSIDVVGPDDVDQDGQRRHRGRRADRACGEVVEVVARASDATRNYE